MGRTTFSGPVRGAYIQLPFVTTLLPINSDIGLVMIAPMAFRISEITATAEQPVVNVTYRVRNLGTGGAGTNDIIAVRAVPAVVETITPTSSPALAFRDVLKGERIEVRIASDGTGVADSVLVSITGYTTGHTVALAAND